MFSLITLPDATTTLSSVGSWSTAFFTDLLPVAYMVVGVMVGVFVLGILISAVIRAIHQLRGGRKGGRGRGRR